MTDIVTGANGFVGNVLVRELVKQNKKVKAFVRSTSDISSLENLNIDILKGDILDYDSLLKAFRGIETVYHVAGKVFLMPGYNEITDSVNYHAVNNVIKACFKCGVKKLIYTSTIHAFKEPDLGTAVDETMPYCPESPRSIYDRSKAKASLAVKQASKEGLFCVILNPTGVLGPYDFSISAMTQTFIDFAHGKLKLAVNGAYDFVDVRDVALGHIAASEKGKNGESYILSGERVTIAGMMKMLEQTTGVKAPDIFLPLKVGKAIACVMPIYYWISRKTPCFTKYTVDTLCSNSYILNYKARKELGYSPRPIVESVRDTIDWLVEMNYITQFKISTENKNLDIKTS